jgi:hypothetical protein
VLTIAGGSSPKTKMIIMTRNSQSSKEVGHLRTLLIVTPALVLGVSLGAVIGRGVSPIGAVAQTVTPSATPVAPMHGMPMHGGGMMTNCPAYQSMMQHAHSAADRAMMQSMMGMHQSMQSMHLTGNADHDFMVMMIPHHEMAIAMAKVELQYGKDPRVLALAKNIITAQQKEIDEMQGWLH